MKKIPVLFLTIFTSIFSTYSQWIPFSGIPSEDIQCVRAYNATNYYAGLENAIITTSDAGLNWQIKPVVDLAGNLQPSVVSDVYFTSPTNAIAVGFFTLGNSEAILHSTNGGLNWDFANIYNGGNYPRMNNTIDFPSSLIGFVGGTNGRILRTTNGGTTWSTTGTSITADINDLDFTSTTTGYAACNGYILRTVNGTAWTQISFSGKNLKGIHFPSTTVGYAVGEAGVIYKTTNSGGAWTQLAFPVPSVDFTSVYFTSDNVGYITGDHFIYRTTSGGLYWEKVVKPDDMNQVVFYSATEGLACGDVSQVYHTSNSGETYKPQPDFSYSPTISCYDSIVNLTNLSDPSWSFEWLLNGTVFSTAFSPSLVIPNAGNSVLSLVAINGLERDTLSKTIVVQPSLSINLMLGVPNQICAGQSTTITVTNSEFGVNYRLRNGTVNIGIQQSGNGGTLTFNTGALSATTTLNIRATKTTSCGTGEQINYVTVIIQNPNINKVIYAEPDTICPSTATNIILEQSENSMIYKLMNGTNVIGVQQTGNGGDLSFPTAVLTANTPYFIRGTSPLGCITNFPVINVIVENPTLYTTFSNANPEVGESVEVINNTVNPNGTFAWDFGPDATPQFSSSQNVPALSFSTTGLKTINLTVTSSIGCLKYLTKTINVIDSFNLAACSGINYAGSLTNTPGVLHALTRDLDRNLFTVYSNNNVDSVLTYTGNGDLLVNYINPIPNYNQAYTIVKHSAKGVPMWSTNFRFNTMMAKCGAVVTDNNGNVYVAYYHGDHLDDVRIYSTDGSYVTVNPPTSGSSSQSVVVVKYNTNGMLLWSRTFLDFYTVERLSLKIDESNNILLCGERFTKFDQNGVVLSSLPLYRNDCEPDGMGGTYVTPSTGLGFQYVGSGTGITFPIVTNTHPNTVISAQYIRKDAGNNYYLAGVFRGGFLYGGVNLVDVFTAGPSHEDVFLCKVNSDGTPGWIKQFKVPAQTIIRGFDVQNGVILLATRTYATTYEYVGHSTISNLGGFGTDILFKCNSSGGNDVMTMFHDETSNIGSLVGGNLIYLDPTGQKADYGFVFKTNFTAPSGVAFTKYALPTYANQGIHAGELGCFLNINPAPPVSEFSFDTLGCVGTDIQFTDESTNVPDGWSWSFPGGTPSVSTSQNPLVSYSSPGVYNVELTSTNEYGQGTTTSHQITIAAVPVTNNCFTADSLCNSTQGIALANPSPAGGVFSSSNGSVISGQLFYPSAAAQNAITYVTYSYTDPISGCVGMAADSIFIHPTPSVNFNNFPTNSICYDSQGIVLGNSSPAGGQYSDAYNSPIVNNVIFPTGAALDSWFSVVYTYSNPITGCTAFDSDSIFIHSLPIVQFYNFLEDSVCYSSQGIVLGNSSPAGGQYSDLLNSPILNNTIYPSVSVSQSWFEVLYTYTDPITGCMTFDSDSIFVRSLPIVDFTEFTGDSICYDSQGIVLGNVSPSGGQYSDIYNSPIINNLIFPPTGALNSWLTVSYTYSDPVSGCADNDSDSIFINPLPVVDFSNFSEDSICYSSQGIVLGNSSPVGGQYSDLLNSPIVNNVIYPVGPVSDLWFVVSYTYADPVTGCQGIDSDSIYLDPCLGFGENSLNEVVLATIEMGLKYHILNIQQSSEIRLFNSEGREIQFELNGTNELDLQNYASGMYLLRISQQNSVRTFKILRN